MSRHKSSKMTGGKAEAKKLAEDSMAIAKKIVIYSKSEPVGGKFLKYMQYITALKRNASACRTRSPWVELRTYGALTAIMETLKKVFVCDEMQGLMSFLSQPPKKNGEVKEVEVGNVCNVALSVLSNAFALDYAVRSEAIQNGFISSLQQFINNFTQTASVTFKNAELISRAVKCAANLSNDIHCRESVLRTGVGVSVLKVLEMMDEGLATDFNIISSKERKECFLDRDEIRHLVASCVRAMRILTSDTKFISCGRDHLLKFGGLVTVINVLTWDAKLSSDEDIVLDVIKALTFLSLRIRSAPIDIIDKLVYNAEQCKIRSLVRIFERSKPEDKLYSPVINCLIKFCTNKDISDCLGGLRIFPILLEKLESTSEKYYDDLIKLLMALTKYSSFNQSHLTTSPLIGATLKILKSSQFKEYHGWLLLVYEKLYEVSLSKLVKCDLVNYLCEILRQEIEDCDYDCLRKKITSLDDGTCSIHNSGACPFAPVYRCSSPSYQKIQEEIRSRINANDMDFSHVKAGDDSLSPCSLSPAHSWSSGGSSPHYSEVTSASYSSFSDDEGHHSPPLLSRSFDCESPTPTAVASLTCQEEVDSDSTELKSPIRKKLKLADDLPSESQNEKSLESLKNSVKKISGVLNILHKCTYIEPFPEDMLQIIPIVLGIIVRGKVSLMPQRTEYETSQSDTELHDMSRRTFEVSYKIVLRMCSLIQIFPQMIVLGMIPVLHRLQEPVSSSDNEGKIAVVQEYCANIISRMVGLENDTAGWREGFIMRAILVNDTSIPNDKMDQMILNIPLLYQNHSSLLRKFEKKAKSWTKILEMLINFDETSYYHFEDCALALCSICKAIGMKWKPFNASNSRLLLKLDCPEKLQGIVDTRSENENESNADTSEESSDKVKLVLDDGSTFSVNKDLLVGASPVFSAMFNGQFIEADQRKVHLPKVTKPAVSLLLNQIYILSQDRDDGQAISSLHEYELSTIFELFSLADRFLLNDIYERALNTVISKYICPFSAPQIYAESVKLTSLTISSGTMLGDAGLNLFILKYILTADSIRMSERCSALRKIFDSVIPEHAVNDLKSLIECHMYKVA